MSCCKRNSGNFYTRPFNGNNGVSPYSGYGNGNVSPYGSDCCDHEEEASYCEHSCPSCQPNEPIGVGGISSPCYNNTDLPCGCSLRDVACRLVNQRAIIHVEGCRMCVIIIAVGKCFLKAVNYNTNKVLYFNLSRIDDIEDVLPRCSC